jgi:hypothetical protein
MKRCPNCNRTYDHQTQKFCTHDGGLLMDESAGPTTGQASANLNETVLVDSRQLKDTQSDDEPTKAISRDLLPGAAPGFDPFKTIMSRPEDTSAMRMRETSDLGRPTPPPPTPPPGAPPPDPVSAPTIALSGEIPPQAIPASFSQPLPPQSSGPIQPPPATGSGQITPPPAPPGSGQVGSAQLPPTPAAAAPAQAAPVPAVAAPRAKRSKLPLILGILFVLLLLGVGALGAGYWFVVRPRLAARNPEVIAPPRKPADTSTPNVETTPAETTETKPTVNEVAPYSPPADAVRFQNSSAKLNGKLKDHYVDFSFYYPNRWEKDPGAGVAGAPNFAKVERRLPPDFTQESFSVGWFVSGGSPEADQAVFHTVASSLSSQYQKTFPEYRKVSEGPTKVNAYDGYEFRFESISRDTAKGDLKVWGRVILLPPTEAGSKNGVVLLMLATSLAPELRSVNDVGVKGELPMMLESFRFGKQ